MEEPLHEPGCSSGGDGARLRFSTFTPRSAFGLFRTLLVGALAAFGSTLTDLESRNAVAMGAEASAEWRGLVQEQMRSESYSRQAIYELGSEHPAPQDSD